MDRTEQAGRGALVTVDREALSQGPPRGSGIKVIGAGLPRTGTLSQKAALERLGFGPCFHMGEVFKDPKRARAWHRAGLAKRRGEPVEWGRLLEGYGATTDWPGSHFWKELAREYPDAKVLLSVRDPEKWYESVRSTIYPMRRSLSRVLPLLPTMRWLPKMLEVIWEDFFGPYFKDRGRAIEAFERHVREVREGVPAERLLVYEVRQGWGPLCEFLGVEVPDEPFPHVNSSADRRGMLRAVGALSYALPLVAGALAGAALLWTGRRVRNSERRYVTTAERSHP